MLSTDRHAGEKPSLVSIVKMLTTSEGKTGAIEGHSPAGYAMLPCARESISSVAPLDDGAEEQVIGTQGTVLEVLLQRTARLCVTEADEYDMESSLAEDSPRRVRHSWRDSDHQPANRCLRKQRDSRSGSNGFISVPGQLFRKSDSEAAMPETVVDRNVYSSGSSIATRIGHPIDREQT
jgi:hypothetical protein